VEKLLLSAIANWAGQEMKVSALRTATFMSRKYRLTVAASLRRIQTAPQGRAYRIRKRSNHITLELGSRKQEVEKNFRVENGTKVNPIGNRVGIIKDGIPTGTVAVTFQASLLRIPKSGNT